MINNSISLTPLADAQDGLPAPVQRRTNSRKKPPAKKQAETSMSIFKQKLHDANDFAVAVCH